MSNLFKKANRVVIDVSGPAFPTAATIRALEQRVRELEAEIADLHKNQQARIDELVESQVKAVLNPARLETDKMDLLEEIVHFERAVNHFRACATRLRAALPKAPAAWRLASELAAVTKERDELRQRAEAAEAKLREWDRVFGTDTTSGVVKYVHNLVRPPNAENPIHPACPGCGRILNWPYESGRWRKVLLSYGGDISYQHEHQDQWVACPGKLA